MSPITSCEDALLERVRATFPEGHLRAIGALPGALNAEMLRQLAPRAPGVYSSFLGGSPARGLPEQYLASTWALYVITAHASGQVARRRGDAVAIGAYEILPAMIAAVIAAPIPEFGAARLVRVENLWSGTLEKRGIALYAATFEIPMEMAGEAPALDDFLRFHADYDIPPHEPAGEHEDWLKEPPDLITSQPDAADDVTLEQ